MKDKIFLNPLQKQFEFDEGVASVFDDMARRSIPYYSESLNLSVDFALNFIQPHSNIYDLGCSTGNFLIELAKNASKIDCINLIGIDNSIPMIERAKLKTQTYGYKIDFHCDDFLNYPLKDASVIIANYTMQFIRPLNRPKMIEKIFNGLKNEGIFIMSEKMSTQDKILDKKMIDRYYLYKKEQGYTHNEINAKRESLENVLIPYSLDENISMLKSSGFKNVEVIFKWVNFGTLIARKF